MTSDNSGLNSFSDVSIQCDHDEYTSIVTSYHGRELYRKLTQTFLVVSGDVVFYHDNYNRIFVEIKRARKKKRSIRKVNVPQNLLGDKRIVLLLVSNWAEFLRKANEEFLNDFDVVLAAVTKCGSCLKYLPANHPFLNHPEIGFRAVKSYGESWKYLSENLKNDRRIVLRAATSNLGYYHLPLQFRNDREIVVELFKKQAYHMNEWLIEEFLDDSQIILLTREPNSNSEVINRISSRLRNDVNFIFNYTKINKHGFKNFPSKFHDDFEFVKRLVESHLPLRSVPDKWKSNLEIVRFCVKRDQFELFCAPMSVWENKAFLLEIAPFAGEAIFFFHKVEFDSQFILQVISLKPSAYLFLPRSYMNRENALLAIEKNKPRCMLNSFPESLLNDRELVITSLDIPTDAANQLNELPAIFKDDKEIVRLALKLHIYQPLTAFMSDNLLGDEEFIKEIIEMNPSSYKTFYFMRQREMLNHIFV